MRHCRKCVRPSWETATDIAIEPELRHYTCVGHRGTPIQRSQLDRWTERCVEAIALTLVRTLYSQLRTCCWTTIVVPLAIVGLVFSGHGWYDSRMQSTSAEAVRGISFEVSYLDGCRSAELGCIHLLLDEAGLGLEPCRLSPCSQMPAKAEATGSEWWGSCRPNLCLPRYLWYLK